MSARTLTARAVVGLLVLGAGWMWLQSPPSGSVPKVKHPNDGMVRFVVQYGPPWEEGGPRSVAWSAGVGHSFEDNGVVSVPDREEGVAMVRAEPGQVATLVAVPARRLPGERRTGEVPEVRCILRYGDGEFAKSIVYGWQGCTVSKTVPPR